MKRLGLYYTIFGMSLGTVQNVAEFYEKRPYPSYSLFSLLFQRVKKDDLPLLNYEAGYAASFGSVEGAARNPKILVVGCGTFEAIAVAKANPLAQILAVDLSSKALWRLNLAAKVRGIKIQTLLCDFEKIPQGKFDYIIATGVLHHLEDPLRGLHKLKNLSHEKTVFRFMVYSRWGRDLLYRAKDLALKLGVRSPKEFRSLMGALPEDHPYKVYFHLYSDAASDDGLSDGYLHPCDQPFDAGSLHAFLQSAHLEVSLFLHRPEGQPNSLQDPSLNIWQRMSLLELYGDLEENFSFFAAVKKEKVKPSQFQWNPALPQRGSLYSKLLGKKIYWSKNKMPIGAEREELKKALLLLPRGSE